MGKRRIRVTLIAVVLVLALALGVAYLQRAQLRTFYDGLLGRDYVGNGSGSVTFVIKSGETGVDVAANLESLGVVKNSDILYRLIVAENTVFYPGTYTLHKQMSSSAALALLSDTTSHVVNRVTIKEGLRIGTALKQLSDATGIPLGKLEAEAKDLEALGIPALPPMQTGICSLPPTILILEHPPTMFSRQWWTVPMKNWILLAWRLEIGTKF
jgi:UPF0755 protein